MATNRRGGIINPPLLRTLTRKDSTTFLHPHGPESGNPYERLVAKLNNLPIIVIKAFGSKDPDTPLNPLLTSGKFTENNQVKTACLPHHFVLAAAEVSATLGGEDSLLTSRVTLWAQSNMPNAPKPPSIKLKTGKGGISGGVIPVDLSTTTNEGPGNKLIALVQNPNDVPNPELKNIGTIQWAKPLDQIIEGLNKIPPEFVLISPPGENGILEFRMNSEDADINKAIYRVDLLQSKSISKEPVQPLVEKEEVKLDKPNWWRDSFGEFNKTIQAGFHVQYDKNATGEFKPYEVYAIKDQNNNLLPISGDQDLFVIPRSSKYKLGDLDQIKIDTHAPGGLEDLINKLRDVETAILSQDLEARRITEDQIEQRLDSFHEYLQNSHTELENLGTVTPYEAYFTIHLNNRTAEIQEEYKKNPKALEKLLEQVDVSMSSGIRDIKTLNCDIHPAWFKELPFEMSNRVEANLANNFYVGPEILLMQLMHKEKFGHTQSEDFNSEAFEVMKNKMNSLAQDHPQWDIFARVPGPPPPTLPGDPPAPGPHYAMMKVTSGSDIDPNLVKDFIILDKTDPTNKNIIHCNEKKFLATQQTDCISDIKASCENTNTFRPGGS